MKRELSSDELLDIFAGLEGAYLHPECPRRFREILRTYMDGLILDIIARRHGERGCPEGPSQDCADPA